MWVQIALFIASLVISYALQPKAQKPKPAAFEDFDFPTVDDGTPQIVVFGDVWLTDWTVIGVGNYRNQPIVSKQSGLFGSKKTTTGYRYLMSIHMGLCRAIDDMIEIKISDRTLWSGHIENSNSSVIDIHQPEIFGGDKAEGGIDGSLTILRGAMDQLVLQPLKNMLGTVPAYRGVVTFFYDGLICSNSPYPKPWSFRVRRTESGWDGSVWYPEKATIWLSENKIKAMNAAHIIYEAQTNRIWGRGFSSSQLDLDSFKSVADQLYAENFGICLAWRRQENLNEFIQQIINQIGAAMFVDRTSGLWKLVLIRDNYNVSDLQTYSYSNGLLNVEDDSNSATDVVTNLTFVNYRDPITNQDLQVRAENLAAIQKHGAIQETRTYSGIPTSDLAGRLAARDMKTAQSNLKRFKLILDRRAYLIQPASVFKISIPERGIDSIVVRAVRVEHDTVINGKISVTVIQDVFGLPVSNYINEQPNLWQPPNHTALPVKNLGTEFRYFDASYYDMCTQFSDLTYKYFFRHWYYYSVIAKAPNPLHLMYKLWIRQRYYDPSTGWHDDGFIDCCTNGNFCAVGKIIDYIPHAYNQLTVQIDISLELLKTIELNSAALVDDEIVRVDAIDLQTSTITMSRGCADSVVAAHAEQSEIWFYDNAISISSVPWIEKVNPQYTHDIYFKFETQTRYDKIKVEKFDNNNVFKFSYYSLLTRAFRPYPPAHVLFQNKICLPNQINYLQHPFNLITWKNRNKVVQADKLFSQSEDSIQLQPNCYTEVTIAKKRLNGWFDSSETFNLEESNSVNPLNLVPTLLDVHAANFLLRTRNPESSGNDPSLEAYVIDVEFYGFGVNFGRHFGGYNG
ncbi:phage tail protein [Acinetobacter ursingii]|uniref:phage tail protein n=1 Tax=Acinetobacter ursingii TaxID=108980 RepID=UPI0021D3AD82|nr:phage tail protein [Acinetobacter ursingii]MCU4571090.1 phage tail protein [Acinetobacter ursingii]